MSLLMIRFEALRLLRSRNVVWLSMPVLGFLPLLVGHTTLYSPLPTPWITMSFIGGHFALAAPRTSTDVDYLLSRTGTRAQLVAARLAVLAGIGLLLWSAFTAVLAARGLLSAASNVYVSDSQLLATLKASGFGPGAYGFLVPVPWAAATPLPLAFLAFLLGAASHAADGPPRPRWEWSRLRDPMLYVKLVPLFAVIFFPIEILPIHSQRLAFFYARAHLGTMVALSAFVIALYAALSLRAWRRADLG